MDETIITTPTTSPNGQDEKVASTPATSANGQDETIFTIPSAATPALGTQQMVCDAAAFGWGIVELLGRCFLLSEASTCAVRLERYAAGASPAGLHAAREDTGVDGLRSQPV